MSTPTEQALSTVPPPAQPMTKAERAVSHFATEKAFELAQRQARVFSSSTLVPTIYQGDNNIGNCVIALEIAQRLQMSPLMVMQNLYVVQGRPSWAGQFVYALIEACGRFDRLKYEVEGGSDPKAPGYRVRLTARDVATGEIKRGAWIDWAMVNGEGWASKNGSKWKTMPEQMFYYRSASFFGRAHAPAVLMGLQTREEIEDVHGIFRDDSDKGARLDRIRGLLGNEAAAADAPADAQAGADSSVVSDVPPAAAGDLPVQPGAADGSFSFDEVRAKINSARTLAELDEAMDLIRHVANPDERKTLAGLGKDKASEIPMV